MALPSASDAWNGSSPTDASGEPGHCRWVSVQHSALSGPFEQCTRPYDDVVSLAVQSEPDHLFPDCRMLPLLWHVLSQHGGRPGDLFVDAGANIGSCTLLMASMNVTTISFEPSQSNLFYLTRSLLSPTNYALKRHVALYRFGLGDTIKWYQLYAQEGNAGNSVLGAPLEMAQRQPLGRVWTQPLDSVASRWASAATASPPRIGVLKIDTQGFETRVLRGARQLLRAGRVRCVAFEVAEKWLHGQNTSAQRLLNLLHSHRFTPMVMKEHCARFRRCAFALPCV